jgi:hypothetical protein
MKGIITIDYEKLSKLYKKSIDSHFHLLMQLENSEFTWGVIYHNKPNKGNVYQTEADIIFLDRFLDSEIDAKDKISVGNTLEFIGPGTGKIATFKILDNCYSDLVKIKYKRVDNE